MNYDKILLIIIQSQYQMISLHCNEEEEAPEREWETSEREKI